MNGTSQYHHYLFLHYYSTSMGILLFVLKYMYSSLLLKMTSGFSWPAKIMASPFKFTHPLYNILIISTAEGIGISCGSVQWANPLGINAHPPPPRLAINFPQGCMEFIWSSPIVHWIGGAKETHIQCCQHRCLPSELGYFQIG